MKYIHEFPSPNSTVTRKAKVLSIYEKHTKQNGTSFSFWSSLNFPNLKNQHEVCRKLG